MIVIVDYGMGNLRSIKKTLDRLEVASIISSDKNEIAAAEKLILPGVGHFANGMKNLHELDLFDILNKKVTLEKTPILGICLGMQLFCKKSEEGDVEGFGWIDAETIRFNVSDTNKFKVPHIGWNTLKVANESPLFSDVSEDNSFYFVHSYHVVCNDNKDVSTMTEFDYEFVSAIQNENIYGTQFHPEKSHKRGMQILRNFVEKV